MGVITSYVVVVGYGCYCIINYHRRLWIYYVIRYRRRPWVLLRHTLSSSDMGVIASYIIIVGRGFITSYVLVVGYGCYYVIRYRRRRARSLSVSAGYPLCVFFSMVSRELELLYFKQQNIHEQYRLHPQPI
ncbi:hypothetical protein ElyMa_003885100 [Elysia marginata]|uniref:Uncharacterized protein n=1 Tax=Elysia marginata TaxID=1093978 RepID=A0AAV4FMK9_9GAST|nr:hypothetical protein ElyMa_003885100 [Elysia marginata]